MAQNIGTLISASIRPNDSLDPIASAYATEIKGGLHTSNIISDRNSIIFERREWGMMCYVIDENKTYQLKYGYVDTDIMNNSNWKEFSGSGGSGGTEWIDSVISFENNQPSSPFDVDRYIIGNSPSGISWSSISPGMVVQWNSSTSKWETTTPKEGMSVRVDSEDNSIYKFEGVFGLGGIWIKDKMIQIRSITATTSDGKLFTSTSTPHFDSYYMDSIFLTKFSSTNLGTTASLNINGLGEVSLKKVTKLGLNDFSSNELKTDIIYTVTYDGYYFQLNIPTNDDIFNVKYYIEPTDYIVVPQYYQYWVYGDLTVSGTLINYGQIIIANGGMNIIGGSFSAMPGSQLVLASLSTGATTSYNDSDTIEFSYQNTVLGPSVSAIVKDGSLTSSKLDTSSNGGPTAGYLLSVDSEGDFKWIEPSFGTSIENSYNDKNFLVTSESLVDGHFTGLTISKTPSGYVGVYVNGVQTDLGYGFTISNSCYFSVDGGTTARNIGEILQGDSLYWNVSIAGYSLNPDTFDSISLFYLE